MHKIYFFSFILLITIQLKAQNPKTQNRGGGRGGFTIGRFYGKMVDNKNRGIGGITIQLLGNKFDTTTKQLKQIILKTVISENNGDFSLEGLSLMGKYLFRATSIGYLKLEMPLTFGIKNPQGGEGIDMQQMAALADKDLGNLKLETDAKQLDEVVVKTTSKQLIELGIDRKIFNVDKNLNSTGQTATEIMKSIPSLSVDIDGNVTLRNATPTIFIDGRPTTLTLDQIPAEIIDKVEIVTNPSAKYDASGGNAGILNIVLKKNKKNGYNGNVRIGIDSRARLNGGSDFNLSQNKINFTGSLNYNQRKSISNSKANTSFFGTPNTDVNSNNDVINNGNFQFYRAGLDYFLDNRNTVSISGNFTKGKFHNESDQQIDTAQLQKTISKTFRNSISDFQFENYGAQLSYKHNFTKDGHNLSGDINYNSSNNSNYTSITSLTNNFNNANKYLYKQKSDGSGYNKYFTIQTDYENPLSETSKIELGARAAIRNFKNDNLQYISPNDSFIISPNASSRYKFLDQVFAAYATYSFKVKKVGFLLGLRAESSNYTGNLYTLAGVDSSSFKVSYPLSLFPSAFITYKLSDKEVAQINYSRRINRPNFFQLLPSYDFTDPQSPSVGNPGLRPEFTNSFELSYSNNYKSNCNFIATAYFKYSTDLITRYVYKDQNKNIQPGTSNMDSLYYTSYINANNSYNYGLELTDKMPITKWWDVLLNFNLFYSQLNATIPNQSINNSLVTWLGKINNTFKIGKGFSFQLTSDFSSKRLIPQSSGGGSRSGGMFGGGSQTLAQGYTLPRYFDIDASIRKDFTFTKGRSASITLSVNEILNIRYKTHTDAFYFTQDTERYRDPQVARLNFSYRFGRFDMNLLKRKNNKSEQSNGMDGVGGN